MKFEYAAIIGSSGSIGHAALQIISEHPSLKKCYALSRGTHKFNHEKVEHIPIDYETEESIAQAASKIDKPLDLVLIATGILHQDTIQPEKSIQQININNLEYIFKVNTFGPTLSMKHFIPKMNHERQNIIAVLSAKVGSIQDNHLGGWYTYRASKSALNMIIKTASIESKHRYKKTYIVGIHPGTVKSKLSQPFTKHIHHEIFEPEKAMNQILDIIKNIKEKHHGRMIAYDGTVIPY